jgi:hypothetical protein
MDNIINRIQDQGRQVQNQFTGAAYWDAPLPAAQIRDMLEDNQDKVVMEGLRRLLAVPLILSVLSPC